MNESVIHKKMTPILKCISVIFLVANVPLLLRVGLVLYDHAGLYLCHHLYVVFSQVILFSLSKLVLYKIPFCFGHSAMLGS